MRQMPAENLMVSDAYRRLRAKGSGTMSGWCGWALRGIHASRRSRSRGQLQRSSDAPARARDTALALARARAGRRWAEVALRVTGPATPVGRARARPAVPSRKEELPVPEAAPAV